MAAESDQIKQLRKLLAVAEHKLAAAEKKAAQAEKRAKEAEKHAEEAERKARLAQLVHDLRVLCADGAVGILQKGLDLMGRVRDLPQVELDNVDALIESFNLLLQLAKESTRLQPFLSYAQKKGGERIGSGKSADDIKDEAKKSQDDVANVKASAEKRRRTIQTRQNALRGRIDAVSDAAAAANKEDGEAASPVVAAAAGISQMPVPSAPEKPELPNKKKTLGRQVVIAPADTSQPKPDPRDFVCPYCGGHHGTELGTFEMQLRSIEKAIGELKKFSEPSHLVMECNQCGRHHLMIPAAESVPVTPLGTVTQKLALTTAHMVYNGVPANRSEKLLCTDELQLGNSTIIDNQHRWMQVAGRFLFTKIEGVCKRAAKVLAVDETPFETLQQSGKSKVKLTGKPKQGYVLIVSSVPNAEMPFAFYYQLDGRGGDYIRARLEGFKPEAFVTDGYPAYDSNATNVTLDGAAHQNCLVHLRRIVLDAVQAPLLPKSDSAQLENVEAMKNKLRNGEPEVVLLMVLEALAKIYANEAALKPKANEDREAFLARVLESRQRYAKPLMEHIDQLMQSLKADFVTYNEKLHQYEKKQDHPVSKAVCYYMNCREELTLFLRNPLVPPDSNSAERCVRAIAVLEEVCKFKQSPAYLDSLCVYFSLFATAELYGIKQPELWLEEYGRALYSYQADRTLDFLVREGLLPKKRLSGFTEDSMEGFPFEEYYPWNYALRKGLLPAGMRLPS